MINNSPSVTAAVEAATRDAASYNELGHALVAAFTDHIPFERFNIGRIDLARNLFYDEFVFGHNVAGRSKGHQRPLDGSVVEAAIQAGSGFYFGDADLQSWFERFPRFGPVFESGIRAMLAVPIRDGDDVVASLVFASRDPKAYEQQKLALAVEAGKVLATSGVFSTIR